MADCLKKFVSEFGEGGTVPASVGRALLPLTLGADWNVFGAAFALACLVSRGRDGDRRPCAANAAERVRDRNDADIYWRGEVLGLARHATRTMHTYVIKIYEVYT